MTGRDQESRLAACRIDRRLRHQRIVAELACPWCGDRSNGGLCARCLPYEVQIAEVVARSAV